MNEQATDDLSNNCIENVTEKLQEAYFPDEQPRSSPNGFMGTNYQSKKQPEVTADGSGGEELTRVVSCARNFTNKTRYGHEVASGEPPKSPTKRKRRCTQRSRVPQPW